jgi:hypothetical protein
MSIATVDAIAGAVVVVAGVVGVGVVGVVVAGDELVTGRHSVWPGWITVAVVAPLAFISAVIDTFWREAMRLHESPPTTE